MKTIEELGISPTPWNVSVEDKRDYRLFSVEADNGAGIACFDCCEEQYRIDEGFANATLIASAPELYKCMREAVSEYCYACPMLDDDKCTKEAGACFVQKWRTALEKARGAE